MDFFDDDTWKTTKNLQDHDWHTWKDIRKEFENDFYYAHEELKSKLENVKEGEQILREFYSCYQWMPSYSKQANLKSLTRTYEAFKQYAPAFKELVNYCPEFSTWLWSDRDNLISIVEDLLEWSLEKPMFAEYDDTTGCYHTPDGLCLAR